MLKYRKQAFFALLKDIFKEVKKNNLRFLLSTIGLAICITVLILTFFINDSNKKWYEVEYLQINNNQLMINDSISMDKIHQLNDSFKDISITYFTNKEKGCFNNNGNNSFYYNLITVSGNFLNTSIPSATNSKNLQDAHIIAGRNFTKEDYILQRDVIILPKAVYNSFFGEVFVGRSLRLGSTMFEVIGVLENTPDINKICYNIKNKIDINTPFPVYSLNFTKSNADIAVLTFPFNVSNDLIDDVARTLYDDYATFSYKKSNISSYSTQKKILDEYDNNEVIMQSVMIICIFIAVIMSIIIVVYSIKDRVNEIAIRKAVGARGRDIWMLLLNELSLITFIATGIGTILGFTLSYAIISLYSIPRGVLLFVNNSTSILLPILFVWGIVLLISTIAAYIVNLFKIVNILKFN